MKARKAQCTLAAAIFMQKNSDIKQRTVGERVVSESCEKKRPERLVLD